MPDGTIPELQRERLLGLGPWLDINGEAIYSTRPWIRAEGKTKEGIPVRFTQRGYALYAILLDRPKINRVTIKSLRVDKDAAVHLLGENGALEWKQEGNNMTIILPSDMSESLAYVLKITLQPLH